MWWMPLVMAAASAVQSDQQSDAARKKAAEEGSLNALKNNASTQQQTYQQIGKSAVAQAGSDQGALNSMGPSAPVNLKEIESTPLPAANPESRAGGTSEMDWAQLGVGTGAAVLQASAAAQAMRDQKERWLAGQLQDTGNHISGIYQGYGQSAFNQQAAYQSALNSILGGSKLYR